MLAGPLRKARCSDGNGLPAVDVGLAAEDEVGVLKRQQDPNLRLIPHLHKEAFCNHPKFIIMKKHMTILSALSLMLCLLSTSVVFGQKAAKNDPNVIIANNGGMPVYIIEREVPNAGKLTPEELKSISEKSCGVLDGMGNKGIKWMHSYVADNKIYCVYSASDTNAIYQHGKNGGFPVNKVSKVSTVISPATAGKQ